MTDFVGTNDADVFIGGTAPDNASGLGGADRLFGGGGGDRIDGGAGNDLVSGSGAIDFSLALLPGDDGEVDFVFGGEGNDVVGGGYGDRLDGGAGVDALVLDLRSAAQGLTIDFRRAATGGTVTIGSGTISAFEGYQKIALSDYADFIRLGDFRVFQALGAGVSAGGGDDRVIGGSFADDISGGAGDDRLEGGAGNDALYGNEGNDVLLSGDGNDLLVGGDGDDVANLFGVGEKYFDGGDGKDWVYLPGHRSDYQVIDEGNGRYTLLGPNRYTILNAETVRFEDVGLRFDDLVPGHVLIGGDGDDRFAPGSSTSGQPLVTNDGDTLVGGNGADYLDGGAGADVITGGPGRDTFVINDIGDRITDGDRDDTILSSISVSAFYAGRIELTGTAAIDGYQAGDGRLIGNGAANVLTGGAGDNILEGRGGDDVLIGGGGFDTVSYETARGGVRVDLGLLEWQNTGGDGRDRIEGFEAIRGSAFNDTLTGRDGGDDVIEGGAGSDTIIGLGGIDTASYEHATAGVTVRLDTSEYQETGGAGRDRLKLIENLLGSQFDDILIGTKGPNSLDGGDGDDLLVGGFGRDVLTGGAGADTFGFASYRESALNDPDFIADFHHDQGDRIDLSGIDANILTADNDTFTVVGAFTRHAGELITTFDGTFGQIFGDVNGDGRADFSILLYDAAPIAPDIIM